MLLIHIHPSVSILFIFHIHFFLRAYPSYPEFHPVFLAGLLCIFTCPTNQLRLQPCVYFRAPGVAPRLSSVASTGPVPVPGGASVGGIGGGSGPDPVGRRRRRRFPSLGPRRLLVIGCRRRRRRRWRRRQSPPACELGERDGKG